MIKTQNDKTQEVDVKVKYKRNYLVYFYGYFAGSLIGTIIHVFLPIYFYNLLNVSRVELAFVQIFSYSALFVKLVISIYFDKDMSKAWVFMILSSIGSLLSFVLLIINVNLLAIFGVFLGVYFACISILDVAIDKFIVVQSPTKKIKEKNALWLNLGALSGAIFPNLFSMLFLSDVLAIESWNLFFLLSILLVAPLILTIFLLKTEKENIPVKISQKNNTSVRSKFKKSIGLMCVFVFFCYADGLYQYPLEPWALEKLGTENIGLFSFFMIIFTLTSALGFVIAGFISHKFDRMKLLIGATIIDGALIAIAPFTNIILFFILISLVYIFSGFIIINMISLMIDIAKSSVLFYQIMSSFTIVAGVVFVPLGTYLSAFVPTEIIIAIAGVLIAASVIPLFFIKEKSILS